VNENKEYYQERMESLGLRDDESEQGASGEEKKANEDSTPIVESNTTTKD